MISVTSSSYTAQGRSIMEETPIAIPSNEELVDFGIKGSPLLRREFSTSVPLLPDLSITIIPSKYVYVYFQALSLDGEQIIEIQLRKLGNTITYAQILSYEGDSLGFKWLIKVLQFASNEIADEVYIQSLDGGYQGVTIKVYTADEAIKVKKEEETTVLETFAPVIATSPLTETNPLLVTLEEPIDVVVTKIH